MNLRERLEIRAVINMIISIIERLAALFNKTQKKFSPKPKVDVPKPNRPRPIKNIVDNILPWRNKK
jgi:hypothetical protein